MASSEQQIDISSSLFPSSKYLSKLMIPHFSNPYSLLEKTQTVSRKQLYETKEKDNCFIPDPSMVGELNELMKRTLPQSDMEKGEKKLGKFELRVPKGQLQETDVKREPIRTP
jgi:hypothetical protein